MYDMDVPVYNSAPCQEIHSENYLQSPVPAKAMGRDTCALLMAVHLE